MGKFKKGDIVKIKKIVFSCVEKYDKIDRENSRKGRDLIGVICKEMDGVYWEYGVRFTESIKIKTPKKYGSVLIGDILFFRCNELCSTTEREEFLYRMYGSKVLKNGKV